MTTNHPSNTDPASAPLVITQRTPGGLGLITLNRPKALNALNNQTLDELQMVFDYVSKENDIYGVIITGEGRGFVAGADIVQMQPYRSEQGRDCLV